MEDPKAPGPNSVVARADALMQRRRQAAARPAEGEEVPVLTDVVDPDDDLPVLTVKAEAAQGAPDKPASPPPPALDADTLNLLAQELTRRVHQRLAAELPSLIEAALQSTLADLTRELRSGIEETAEGAIRDFLNDRARLAKPRQKP